MTKKKKILKKDLNQKKIEELKNQVNEGNEKYLRLLAEWENYRKRTLKEKTASVNYGKESIISKILPILDDFERGIKANDKKDNGDGFQLIIQKLFLCRRQMDIFKFHKLFTSYLLLVSSIFAQPTFTENIISTNANGAESVFATDVDGDGDMDVLSASINDNKIAL